MNKYLVALCVDAVNQEARFGYIDFDIIEADNLYEAEEKYNKKHNCSYYSGSCMAEIVKGKVGVLNKDISYKQIEKFKIQVVGSHRFSVNDKVKTIVGVRDKFHHQKRKGSYAVIQKTALSLDQPCYWLEFTDGYCEWYDEDEIKKLKDK